MLTPRHKKILLIVTAVMAALTVTLYLFPPAKIIKAGQMKILTGSTQGAEDLNKKPVAQPMTSAADNDVVVAADGDQLDAILPADVAAKMTAAPQEPLPPVELAPTGSAAFTSGNLPPPAANFTAPVPVGVDTVPLSPVTVSGSALAPVRTEHAKRSYFLQNLNPSALDDYAGDTLKENPVNPATFIPQSEEIGCALFRGVISANHEVEVLAGILHPLIWHGTIRLPEGTKMLGRAQQGRTRDRLLVKFYKLVFPSGKSLEIDGVAVGGDGLEGIRGRIINDWQAQVIAPLVANAGIAFLQALKSGVSTVSTDNYGYVAYEQRAGNFSEQLTNAGIGGGQKVLDKIEKILSEQIDDYAPYVYLQQGMPFRVYLLKPVDTSKAELGR